MIRPLVLVLSWALAGCAHQPFKATFNPVGDASEIGRFAELSKAANELPPEAGKDVKVLLDKLPDGMTIDDGTLKFDHDRYTLIAMVKIEPDSNWIGLWFATYDRHEAWKNVYCNVQVPLNWITMYTWPVLPFYWPCFQGSLDETGRLEHMVEKLQTAAAAAGGNLVIASAGATAFVNRRTQQVVSTASTTHMVGFILKDNGPSSSKAPSSVQLEVPLPTLAHLGER